MGKQKLQKRGSDHYAGERSLKKKKCYSNEWGKMAWLQIEDR